MLLSRIRRFIDAAYAVGVNTRTYWWACPHCAALAPWITDTAQGDHRCTRCGTDLPEGPEA